jgi:hypothetical protein
MKKKRKQRNKTRQDPVEQASEFDRKWFEAHPGVNAYLRPLIPGEFRLYQPSSKTVLVEQLKPGFRARLEVADGISLAEALLSRPLLTDRDGNPISGLEFMQPLWSRGMFHRDPRTN